MDLKSEIESSRQDSIYGLDIPWMLAQWSDRLPDKSALIWCPFDAEEQSWTYQELLDSATRLAARLQDRGVKDGEFVILHLDNAPEFVIAWYGCALIGAVAVSTNTHSVASDLSYFQEVTEAVCAITQPCFAELIHEACPNPNFVVVTDNDAGTWRKDAGDIARSIGGEGFESLYSGSALMPLECDPQRNLGIQFTSGTTSRPKAVLWTHVNGLWAGKVSAINLRLRRDDVTLAYMPLFHTASQGFSMLATHWSGGTLVLHPKFSASRFWDTCNKNGVTWTNMVSRGLTWSLLPSRH